LSDRPRLSLIRAMSAGTSALRTLQALDAGRTQLASARELIANAEVMRLLADQSFRSYLDYASNAKTIAQGSRCSAHARSFGLGL
jgi:prophage DNA circulation protein